MMFEATSSGTAKMSKKLGSARSRLFDRMSCSSYSAEEANNDFFDEDEKL